MKLIAEMSVDELRCIKETIDKNFDDVIERGEPVLQISRLLKYTVLENELRDACVIIHGSDSDVDKLDEKYKDVKDNTDIGKGCECCSELFTGDCNEDLIFHNYELNGVTILQTQVFINNDALEMYTDDSYGHTVAKENVKINYCPMCGRRLVKWVKMRNYSFNEYQKSIIKRLKMGSRYSEMIF